MCRLEKILPDLSSICVLPAIARDEISGSIDADLCCGAHAPACY
jgi:hypothetical protein